METEVMSSVLASVSTRREKASKAMTALHSHRNVITACITEWENLEHSFGVTERALQQKFKELAELEVEFDAKMKEVHTALDKREESIAGREEASLAHLKEQKDTAIAAVAEELRKLDEERSKWRAEKGVPAPPPEVADGHVKASGKADVHTKTYSKDTDRKLTALKETKKAQQGKGSPADSSSKKVHNDKKKTETKPGLQKRDVESNKGAKGDQQGDTSKSKRKDVIAAIDSAGKRQKQADSNAATAGSKERIGVGSAPSLEEAIKQAQNLAAGPRPIQTKDPAAKGDHKELKEFIPRSKKKDLKRKMRAAFLAALQSSGDPCRFALKLVESSEGEDVICNTDHRVVSAGTVLLECLSELVADPVLGVDFPVIPSDIKELARSLARRWKPLLEKHTNLTLASHIFLQLLATFGIGTDYSADDLVNYAVAMSRNGIGPALCKTLGLTEKIPVIVDLLMQKGKPSDAIAYASTFGLLEKVDLGALLNSFVEDSEKTINTAKAAGSVGSMIGVYSTQILSFKHAIKSLVDHKLESQVSVEDLRKRLTVLRNEKMALKNMSLSVKRESKNNEARKGLFSGRPDDFNKQSDEAGTRPSFESSHEMHGRYISSSEQGRVAPTGLGRPNIVDYTPTDIGRPLFPPYNFDRLSGRPESTFDNYGLGGRSPVSAISNPYFLRDSLGSRTSGSSSALPGIHSYHSEMPASFSSSQGRHPYPETRGPSANYRPLGGGLPPPASYLPYYLR